MDETQFRHCWQIMQCDEEDGCPVRMNKIERCWEWMDQHFRLQSQFGLCAECIVYLAQNDNPLLSAAQIKQIMVSRGLFQDDPAPIRPAWCSGSLDGRRTP